MAEAQEGEQPQARPQPELAASTDASVTVTENISASTPSTPALPGPVVPGAAPTPDDTVAERTAHASPKPTLSPTDQHHPNHQQQHAPSSLHSQPAASGKDDAGDLREQGAQSSPQAIAPTIAQTTIPQADGLAEARAVRGGSIPPHLPPESRSPPPEIVTGSGPESQEEHRPQPTDVEAGVAAAAHEQVQGEKKEYLQEKAEQQDPTSQQRESSATNDTLHSTTTPTSLPANVSSLITSPAATATTTTGTIAIATTAAATNGVVSTGQANGHVSTSTSPSPAPTTMSNPPSQLPGPSRPLHQQHTPPINYSAQSTYGIGTGTGAGTSLNNQYGYASTAAQPSDIYRSGANVANTSMSLPSMRTFDPVQQAQPQQQQQQQQQQHQQQQHNHASIARPHAVTPSPLGNVGYYQQQPTPLTSNHAYGLTSDAIGGHRYPLPPNDPRAVLSGTRHKKVGREVVRGILAFSENAGMRLRSLTLLTLSPIIP